jgi:hypothetical protein
MGTDGKMLSEKDKALMKIQKRLYDIHKSDNCQQLSDLLSAIIMDAIEIRREVESLLGRPVTRFFLGKEL